MVAFLKQVEAAGKTDKDERTKLQQKVLELYERLTSIMLLRESFGPPRGIDSLPSADELKKDPQAIEKYLVARQMAERVEEELKKAKARGPCRSPASRKLRTTFGSSIRWPGSAMRPSTHGQGSRQPAIMALEEMKVAYVQHDASTFNHQLANYEAYLNKNAPPQWNADKLRSEWKFNYVSPFFVGMEIYVLGFLLAIFGWLTRYRPLNWAAFVLILLTFVLHTIALAIRIDISGRPPVTNLYSSAVFIGWGGVVLGLASRRSFGWASATLSARWPVLRRCSSLILGGSTATRSPCCRRCSTRNSGWPRTSSASRSATRRRIVAGLFGAALHRARRAHAARSTSNRQRLARMIYGIALLRDLVQLRGHGARRHVGRRLLGPLLGLGSQGERRPDDRALERADPACPLGQAGRRPRPGRAGGRRQHRHHLVVVWRQPTRHGPARLRLHAGRCRGRHIIRPQPIPVDRRRPDTDAAVVELQADQAPLSHAS